MHPAQPRPTRLHLLTLPTALATALIACLAQSLRATVIEQAADSAGTFRYVLQDSGTVTLVTSPVRAGTHAHRSAINASTAPQRRAEIDDNQFGAYEDNTYWYGMSYHLAADGSWDGNFQQYVAQWRLSNLKEGGSTVPNCNMNSVNGGVYHGGSGHHLEVRDGRWKMFLLYPDPTVGSCLGALSRTLDLGPINKGVWTDFVFQARWSHLDTGFVRVWKQVNGGGYQQVKTFYGPTWFDTYAAGSAKAGQKVNSPNFTVGLYYGSDAKARVLHVDEIRVSDFPGDHGFDQVKVAGSPSPLIFGARPWTSVNITSTGGSATYIAPTDEFRVYGAGVGPSGPSDALRFTYVPLDGDGEIVTRVGYLQNNVSSNARAGLMLRSSLAANAAHLSVALRPAGEVSAQWRSVSGGSGSGTGWGGGTSLGKALRLVRFNNTVSAYYSVNGVGTGWKLVARQPLPLGSTAYVGIYTASGTTATVESKFLQTGLVTTPAATPNPPGPGPSGATLAARYRLEQNLNDAIAGLNLAPSGGLGAYSTDKREGGFALRFDGVDDRATRVAGGALSPTGPITLTAWVRPDSDAGGVRRAIFSNSNEDGYYLRLTADRKIELVIGRPNLGGPLAVATSQSAVPLDTWSHIAAAIDLQGSYGYVFFYLNGTLAGTWGFNQGVLEAGTGSVVLGAALPTGGSPFKGLLDDLRLYQGTLTRPEVSAIASGQ